MNLSHLNIAERKEFLMKHLRTGKMMSATWETASKGLTTRTVKLFAERAFASGDRRFVNPPSNTKENMVNLIDMAKFNSEAEYPWVTLTLDKLKELKVGGTKYEF